MNLKDGFWGVLIWGVFMIPGSVSSRSISNVWSGEDQRKTTAPMENPDTRPLIQQYRGTSLMRKRHPLGPYFMGYAYGPMVVLGEVAFL